jgi:hypothetical protein
MATPHVAVVRVLAPVAAPSLVGVLRQALHEQNREEPVELALTADTPPDVLVRMTLNADDASSAQLDAQKRVRDALHHAGIEDNADDVAIEATS